MKLHLIRIYALLVISGACALADAQQLEPMAPLVDAEELALLPADRSDTSIQAETPAPLVARSAMDLEVSNFAPILAGHAPAPIVSGESLVPMALDVLSPISPETDSVPADADSFAPISAATSSGFGPSSTFAPISGFAPDSVLAPIISADDAPSGEAPEWIDPDAIVEEMGCDSGCDNGCDSCDGSLFCDCNPASRRRLKFWGDVEYLLWWTEGADVPPLVTTAPRGTASGLAGLLDQPSTRVLFGGDDVDRDTTDGVRAVAGFWLDDQHRLGVGGRYFQIADDVDYSRSSFGTPILARPFFNVNLGTDDAVLVAYPALAQGTVFVEDSLDIQSAELFLRHSLLRRGDHQLDVIGGYQFGKIDSTIRVGHSLLSTDPTDPLVPPDTTIDSFDLFEAENEFHGGVVGLLGEHCYGCLTWRSALRIALGNVRQEVHAVGQTTTTLLGGPSATRDSGLLVQPSNLQPLTRNELMVIPELNLSAGYGLTQHLDITVGYNVIYWSDLVLAGNSIDLRVDPTQAQPFPMNLAGREGFWAHGLSFGLSCKF